MNSGRREQGEDRTLEGWDSWIDRAIRAAHERGEFDNLSNAGKPLRIYSNPLAPEWDSASGLLKDAGVAPFWVELDKEILAELAALGEMRERARQRLAELEVGVSEERGRRGPSARPKSRWWSFRRSAPSIKSDESTRAHDPAADLEAWRERAREAYLERAARLDRKIAEYHTALPGELWWLQKPRLSPETAARDFDEACPPARREARQDLGQVTDQS